MTDPNTPTPPQQPVAPSVQPPAYSAPAYQAPAYQAAPAYAPPAYPTGGPAAPGAPVPGRTLGIVALIVAIFFNFIGIILGIVALVQSRKAGAKNGFAVAAIIVGAVLFVIGVIVTIVIFSQFIDAANACLSNPSGTATVWGITIPCTEVTSTR